MPLPRVIASSCRMERRKLQGYKGEERTCRLFDLTDQDSGQLAPPKPRFIPIHSKSKKIRSNSFQVEKDSFQFVPRLLLRGCPWNGWNQSDEHGKAASRR